MVRISCIYSLKVLFIAFTFFTNSCNKNSNEPTKDSMELATPRGLHIQAAATSAKFTWSPVAGSYGYLVEIGKGTNFSGAFYKSDTLFMTTFEVANLEAKTDYTIRLKALHKDNPSATSKGLYETFKTAALAAPEEAFAFPGAEGAGKLTTGGRGGKVIKVTNLNDAGAGSLRDAINQAGKRIIVFEVSGNIKLKSRLQIKNGDVTIAGQTAPGDGICIQDQEVNIAANNVIIRYMRFRLGDTYVATIEADALWGRDLQDIILDHCSTSWSIDETASFYHNKNFTMQWCMITESLTNSGHSKGSHGYGGIWGGSPATFHHNLIAHHTNRNPRFDGGLRYSSGSGTQVGQFGPDKIDYRNNVIYNWSGNSTYGGENGQYNFVNNYYKSGPATPANSRYRFMQVSKDNATGAPDPTVFGVSYGTYYLSGNYMAGNGNVTANNWAGIVYDGGVTEAMAKKTEPFAFGEVIPPTAEQAFEAVLKYGGASYKRDAVDTRIMNEVRNGTATYKGSISGVSGIIDTQKDVGGWPVLNSLPAPADVDADGMPDAWETANDLDPKTANANGRNLSNVYDNIEVYINSLVKAITDGQKL
ncbi:pectate lyase [Niabella yanshanensis]|uniref:Pectate lyase n=1 Tax=Niabella yanshanensis TaxID=577386 RepID=A0ABZ0VZN9_9BACT|nr:pectate lyase [Niabella yanshanensis]WQD36396.1 pectate lyase [Niabella yanshanensis]